MFSYQSTLLKFNEIYIWITSITKTPHCLDLLHEKMIYFSPSIGSQLNKKATHFTLLLDPVFGGICRETKACFLVPVELPIIRAHILPGTRVMSDKWKAYDYLQNEGYIRLTVNYWSLNFVDLGAEVCPAQERPKNSTKATYRSGCSISIITRILLATLSSRSSTIVRSARTHEWFSSRSTTSCTVRNSATLHFNRESKNKIRKIPASQALSPC